MKDNGHFRAGIILCAAALFVAMPAFGQEEYEWKDGKWAKAVAPAKGTAAGELALIRQYVEKGQWRDAVSASEKWLKKYREDPAAEEVRMLGGMGEMIGGRYFQAFELFEAQLTQFPNGQYAERALEKEYEIAEAFLAGKKRIVLKIFYVPAEDDGIAILNRVAEHAPGSNLAEKSLMRIADYHYNKQDYLESVKDYDRYMEVFGKSARASYAMHQGARASYGAYRGPEWDDTPLLDAQTRYRLFADRFPMLADRANVPRILEQIRGKLAQKMYVTAEFYERVHRDDPARFYYRQVVEKYPQTEWSTKASGVLRRLGEAPERRTPTTGPVTGIVGDAGFAPANAAPSTQPASSPADTAPGDGAKPDGVPK